MKKLAILMAILILQAQVTTIAATARRTPAKATKQAVKKAPPKQEKIDSVYNDSNFLLKYNIDDLEAAPWLNGGKRKI